jgi:IMP dehydrogenase
MATIRDILNRKGAAVIAVPPATTVLDAAQLMNDRGIGAVLVTEGPALAGIFTERDLMRRVVATRRDPATTPVSQVMTASLVTISTTATVEECASLMTARRIRHLPVLDGETLTGVVTIGDLMAFQVDEQASTIAQLNSYVYDNR